MKSGRLAIIRGGNGIGDLLISSMLPRILKENGDFHIDHFCWPENKAVLLNNPYIDKISMYPNKDDPEYKRIIGENSNNYDAILITAWTLEKMFLWRTSGEWGIPSLENRRKANEGVNYTEAVLKAMGIEINGQVLRPEIYFSKQEQETIEERKEQKRKEGKIYIGWNLKGSTMNKQLVNGIQYIKAMMKFYPNAEHYLLGSTPVGLPPHPAVHDTGGSWSLRTSIAFLSMLDLLVGPESAMVNAAGAFDTPTVCFYSMVLPDNLARHYQNHWPIQPACDCHPCYLIPINFRHVYDITGRKFARELASQCIVRDEKNPFKFKGTKCNLVPVNDFVQTAVQALTER